MDDGNPEGEQTEEAPTRPGVKTRASNAKNRPGVKAYEALGLTLPKSTKRRTSSEVAADKAALAEEKLAKAVEQQERVTKVARLELQMEEEDERKVMCFKYRPPCSPRFSSLKLFLGSIQRWKARW